MSPDKVDTLIDGVVITFAGNLVTLAFVYFLWKLKNHGTKPISELPWMTLACGCIPLIVLLY